MQLPQLPPSVYTAGSVAFVVPALWMSMNLLAAVVQTMVFSFLVTAYYTLSLKPETAGEAEEPPTITEPELAR